MMTTFLLTLPYNYQIFICVKNYYVNFREKVQSQSLVLIIDIMVSIISICKLS